jgi:hypothetical protein
MTPALPAYLETDGGTRYGLQSAPPAVQWWRVLHDVELAGLWRPVSNAPEVFRLEPIHHVLLTEPIQWLWRRMNPLLTDKQWTALLGNGLAFTNGTGFPGHANYILREELNEKDPRFDQARICGGALVRGRVEGLWLWIENVIDVRKPLPTVQQVYDERRYFVATTARDDGTIGMFKGRGLDVFVPLLVAQDVRFPLMEQFRGLVACDMSKPLPSPYEVMR